MSAVTAEDTAFVPKQERHGAAPTRMSVRTDEAMVRAFLDAHDGDVRAATVDWRELRVKEDEQIVRDVEAAQAWEPSVKLRPLTPQERHELKRILAEKRPTVGAVGRRRHDASKGRAYALVALEGEAAAVVSAPKGLRNHTLNESAWTLARPELDGILDAQEIEGVLVSAAHEAGLPEREARSTVHSALRKRGRL